MELVLVAAAVALLLVPITAAVVRSRFWTPFNGRVDRRRKEQRDFEASWDAIIRDADTAARAQRLQVHNQRRKGRG